MFTICYRLRCAIVIMSCLTSCFSEPELHKNTEHNTNLSGNTDIFRLGVNANGFVEYRCLKDESTMILIPAGDFLMGSDELFKEMAPQHKVYLDAYLLDKTELTWKQYIKYCRETGCDLPKPPLGGIQDDHPVTNVNWYDAVKYCRWAGKRLPTEAEWEKGARGIDGRKWPWGNSWNIENANAENINNTTTPVGSYPSGESPWGIMDMVGNVMEWCADWFDESYYSRSEIRNPRGTTIGSRRILRGGSWHYFQDGMQTASRYASDPETRDKSTGFRGARNYSK